MIMLIKDVLSNYYSSPNQEFATPEARYRFELLFLGGKLNSDMNTIAKDHAGCQFFNYYWRRFDGRDSADIYSPVHPDTIVAAAASLGFVDVELLAGWVDSLKEPLAGKVSQIANGTSSNITLAYDAMPDISFADIQTSMLEAMDFVKDPVWHALDDSYKLPSKADIDLILANCPTKKMQYRTSKEDCDDFANMFKAWLGYLGYGNISIGYIEMILVDSTSNTTGAHAVNSCIFRDTDGSIQVKLIEPQTNTLHDPKVPWVGAGINGMPVKQLVYWSVI